MLLCPLGLHESMEAIDILFFSKLITFGGCGLTMTEGTPSSHIRRVRPLLWQEGEFGAGQSHKETNSGKGDMHGHESFSTARPTCQKQPKFSLTMEMCHVARILTLVIWLWSNRCFAGLVDRVWAMECHQSERRKMRSELR
jgi:hypothetical protein